MFAALGYGEYPQASTARKGETPNDEAHQSLPLAWHMSVFGISACWDPSVRIVYSLLRAGISSQQVRMAFCRVHFAAHYIPKIDVQFLVRGD